MADNPDEINTRQILAQHPGGLIWEPHQGKMRITPETQWGALADDLLPLVREAAQELANPLMPGANTHDRVIKRAAKLVALLEGDIDQVARKAAAIYTSSIWFGETWDTDKKLRGANDPMGEPLSDPMRRALSELIAVLPAFARQFPSVLKIEDEREEFFAEAENLTAVKATVEGAREANVIDAENEAPVQEALAAGAGAGALAIKGQKTAARSTRNLVLASVVSASLGFVSGEMIGGVGDAFGVDLRAATTAFVRREKDQIATIFSSAPVDQQEALKQSVERLLSGQNAPAGKPKGKTHVVSVEGGLGDFTSIQAAIDAAEPGDRIVVREGTYRESLHLSKVLEIIGEGDRERIVVTTDKGNALHCDAPLARIAGLRFRREAGGTDYGIWITAGAAEIEDCVVESRSLSCVVLSGTGTMPTLRRCLLRDGEQGGLYVVNNAQATVEGCQFIGHAFPGVAATGQATRITLRRCLVAHGNASGFNFDDGASGLLDECEAAENADFGVIIRTGSDIVLRNCTLHENGGAGLTVSEAGQGMVEGGKITGNGGAGVAVAKGSTVIVTGCTITDNTYAALWVLDADGTGTFHNNDLRGNGRGAWDIAEGAKVERSGNME